MMWIRSPSYPPVAETCTHETIDMATLSLLSGLGLIESCWLATWILSWNTPIFINWGGRTYGRGAPLGTCPGPTKLPVATDANVLDWQVRFVNAMYCMQIRLGLRLGFDLNGPPTSTAWWCLWPDLTWPSQHAWWSMATSDPNMLPPHFGKSVGK